MAGVDSRTPRLAVVMVAALTWAGGAGVATAATFTVNSAGDTGDTLAGDGVCLNASGYCTLRAAIQEANALAGADSVVFSQVFTISIGDPLIVTSEVTVNGGGGNRQALDGGGVGQVLRVLGVGADLTLVNLEIRNGAAPADGKGGLIYTEALLDLQYCSLNGGQAVDGGAIYSIGGNLSASFTTISSNQATSRGGGIHQYAAGSVTLWNTTIGANTSQGHGGGIWYESLVSPFPVLTVSNSHINGNQANPANGDGGGIHAAGVDVVVEYSTVDNNSARHGGGLYHREGSTALAGALEVVATAVTGNSAVNGGGIHYDTATATPNDVILVNTTLAANSADNSGGGLYFAVGSEGHLSSCTVTGNHADADDDGNGDGGGIYAYNNGLVIRNSLIADNSDDSSGMFDPYAPDCAVRAGVAIVSDGYNLVGFHNGLCVFSGDTATDITTTTMPAIDPRLGALGLNGCGSDNAPPLGGSPAIDAGNPAGCLDHAGALITEDQCGASRPYGSACDIGAVESSITSPIFTNGFEAGSFSGWSAVTP